LVSRSESPSVTADVCHVSFCAADPASNQTHPVPKGASVLM
jgi:hypothetical protein